jgi:hypothetical protein
MIVLISCNRICSNGNPAIPASDPVVFSKDLVAQTIKNLILAHKSASSSILTMMRRVGDCPGQT